jgi:CRISPR/Cas system-associated endonuclease Cas1
LALDLAEALRPLVAESVLLNVVNNAQVDPATSVSNADV